MLIEIDFNSDEAIYVQLQNQIIMGIATATIHEGDALPSVRQLADRVGINMHTVNKAYSVLKQEGFIQLDRRRGAVIAIDANKAQAILEMKAQRLKTLTEDVVEASKVSSGNIKLELMTLNLVELIYQVEGEYEEKFEARNLKMILNMPDEPVMVRVDGRRMWRVFANIFNNAAKYAMEGSRVYADLMIQPGTAKFILKNVSDQQLNISADELTERFIRGDVSRSTEGSGLGLSIAKNLTELQGGTFELYLDGDLFKVLITFPRVRRLIKEQPEKKEEPEKEPEEKPEQPDKTDKK